MKKILFSAMAILLSLGLIGAAFANFSDTETSLGNTFEAGTIDLVMGENWGSAVISMSDMKAGASETVLITYKNIGTLGDGLAVWSFGYIELDGAEVGTEYTNDMSADDVAKALYLTTIMWDDGIGAAVDMTDSWTAYGGDKDGDGSSLSVYDLKAVTDDSGMGWEDPTAMAQNVEHSLSLTITFDPQRTLDSHVPLDISITDFPPVNAFQSDGINGTISVFLPQE